METRVQDVPFTAKRWSGRDLRVDGVTYAVTPTLLSRSPYPWISLSHCMTPVESPSLRHERLNLNFQPQNVASYPRSSKASDGADTLENELRSRANSIDMITCLTCTCLILCTQDGNRG